MTQGILETAVAAARAAGAIQREHYGTLLKVDEAKRHDIKLNVDRLCEEAISERIRRAFPDHAVLGEEGGEIGGNAPYRWIVDPLDGTVNFFYGIPYFCTSVACYRRRAEVAATYPRGLDGLGDPVAGAIYMPLLDELFAAEVGRGATLNGAPIRAATATALDQAIVATGFGGCEEDIRHMFRISQGLAPKVRKIRCLGAAAYDLANVACGRLTAFSEKGLRSWDIAAGAILVREAGGVFDGIEYEPSRWDTIACARGIHAVFSSLVRSA